MRRQLPAYSPLELSSIGRACLGVLPDRARPQTRLGALLASRYPCREVILTGSGTQALELAIRFALGSHKGRFASSVALPAYSCFDVLTAAVGAGAHVTFCDVDPRTLTPEMDSLASVLSEGAAVVVVSNLFGFPVDWDSVRGACTEAGAVLIEDAAQGMGSAWLGRAGGTFGDLTVLSFGRGKGWSGGGGGGLLVRGERRAHPEGFVADVPPARPGAGFKALLVALARWTLGRPSLYGIPSALRWLGLGETTYKEPLSLRSIPSFSAALALETHEASVQELRTRRRMARRVGEILEEATLSGRVRPVFPLEGGESGYLRFPVLSNPSSRPALASREARAVGIMPGYPRSLPELAATGSLGTAGAASFPGARRLSQCLFTLPPHSLLAERDLANLARHLSRPGGIGG